MAVTPGRLPRPIIRGGRGSMPVRHAMLVITRAVFDMVEIPGQEPLVVAKDTGDEAARRWWDERVRAVAADVFERNSETWERRTGGLAGGHGCRGGQGAPARRRSPGGRGPDPVSRRHRDGGGPAERARLRHGGVPGPQTRSRPSPPSSRNGGRPSRSPSCTPGSAGCSTAADHMPVDIGLPVSQFGYPIREVLGCLDRLSADGWQIVHVSEDRAGTWTAGPRTRTPSWRSNRASARRVTCSAGRSSGRRTGAQPGEVSFRPGWSGSPARPAVSGSPGGRTRSQRASGVTEQGQRVGQPAHRVVGAGQVGAAGQRVGMIRAERRAGSRRRSARTAGRAEAILPAEW